MTMMVTGHRKLVPAGWAESPWPENNPQIQRHHTSIYLAMYEHVKAYAIKGNTTFITGMAIGADQLFAQAVIRLLDDGIPCRIIAAVPFKGQESIWPVHQKEIYHTILSRCEVNYVCEPGYAPYKMQRRNEWMVNMANEVLAVWDGLESGGTFNAMMYAIKKGKVINRLDPYTFTIKRASG